MSKETEKLDRYIESDNYPTELKNVIQAIKDNPTWSVDVEVNVEDEYNTTFRLVITKGLQIIEITFDNSGVMENARSFTYFYNLADAVNMIRNT